jgi:hypothetical protein
VKSKIHGKQIILFVNYVKLIEIKDSEFSLNFFEEVKIVNFDKYQAKPTAKQWIKEVESIETKKV